MQATQPQHILALERAHAAPRCGAKTRTNTSCKSPAMPNGKCRMHGGANKGAPCGERNGNYRHGFYGREWQEVKRDITKLI